MERWCKAARRSTRCLPSEDAATPAAHRCDGSNLDLEWMAGKNQFRLFHWTNLRGGGHGETRRTPGFGASDAAAACADPSLALCGNAGGDPERAASQRTAFAANTRPRASIRDCTRDGGCSV